MNIAMLIPLIVTIVSVYLLVMTWGVFAVIAWQERHRGAR